MKVLYCENDGLHHLKGSGLCTFETACGWCDSFNTYIEKEGKPDCKGCIDVAQIIIQDTTKKEVMSW